MSDVKGGGILGHKESAIMETRLWCVHVYGPDDLIAAKTQQDALLAANALNAKFVEWRASPDLSENDPVLYAVAEEWPYSSDAHAKSLAKTSKESA